MKPTFTLGLFLLISLSLHGQKYFGGENGKKFDYILYYLDEYYVDSTDNDSLTEVAIISMLKTLDPYSVYQSKEEIKKQMQRDSGVKEVSVGITVYNLNGQPIITYIEEDSPAGKSTISKGDILVSIDDVPTDDLLINDIYKKLRGTANSEVKLTLLKPNQQQKEVVLQRGNVAYNSITAAYNVTDQIGYIKLSSFTLKTIEEFENTIKQLNKPEHLILDLRGNRGGVVDAAYALADKFLGQGKLIFSKVGKSFENESHTSTSNGEYKKGKVIILTNGVTASASEIFTGALQDWDRALIIGKPSFGKGLIQQSYKLDDSSAVRLTIGRYNTPTGRSLQRPYNAQAPWINNNKTSLDNNGFINPSTIPNEVLGKTKGGRPIISDNGGIHPDIFEERDIEKPVFLQKLFDTALLYDFAVNIFYANMKDGNINAHLELNEEDLEQLLRSYIDKKVELGYTQLLPIPNTISTVTMTQLRSWLYSLFDNYDGYYNIYNSVDPVFQKAIESMNNNTMKRIKIKS